MNVGQSVDDLTAFVENRGSVDTAFGVCGERVDVASLTRRVGERSGDASCVSLSWRRGPSSRRSLVVVVAAVALVAVALVAVALVAGEKE